MMILEMERITNPSWFNKRKSVKDDHICISANQYWDWLNYIDVS